MQNFLLSRGMGIPSPASGNVAGRLTFAYSERSCVKLQAKLAVNRGGSRRQGWERGRGLGAKGVRFAECVERNGEWGGV